MQPAGPCQLLDRNNLKSSTLTLKIAKSLSLFVATLRVLPSPPPAPPQPASRTGTPFPMPATSAPAGTPPFATRASLSAAECRGLDDLALANLAVFGHRGFRPCQRQACHLTLSQQDCFVLMPTGGGKSLCYQVRYRWQGGGGEGSTECVRD